MEKKAKDVQRVEITQRLLRKAVGLVVADEGHQIKNSDTRSAKALMTIATKKRIALTGYPPPPPPHKANIPESHSSEDALALRLSSRVSVFLLLAVQGKMGKSFAAGEGVLVSPILKWWPAEA